MTTITVITVKPTGNRFPHMVPELMPAWEVTQTEEAEGGGTYCSFYMETVSPIDVWEVTAHLFNRCRKEGRGFALDNQTAMEL